MIRMQLRKKNSQWKYSVSVHDKICKTNLYSRKLCVNKQWRWGQQAVREKLCILGCNTWNHRKYLKQKRYLLLGVLNTEVGKIQRENVGGRFEQEILNGNGKRLIEICERLDLTRLNMFLQHKGIDIHRYAWLQERKNQNAIRFDHNKHERKANILSKRFS